jgi:hypothetical protein
MCGNKIGLVVVEAAATNDPSLSLAQVGAVDAWIYVGCVRVKVPLEEISC